MSNVSNRHGFIALEKNTKALSGQRLVRLIAKKDRDGNYHPNLTASLAVSIPPLDTSVVIDSIESLLPHVVRMLQDTQDSIIREYRLDSGADSVPEEIFGVAQCVAYLDSNATGGRLTTEALQEWFSEVYADAAEEFIRLAVNGISDEKMNEKRNVLRDMFAGFASARYSPDIPKCKAMMKFGVFLTEANHDPRMASILTRVAKIKEEKEAELNVDALGF